MIGVTHPNLFCHETWLTGGLKSRLLLLFFFFFFFICTHCRQRTFYFQFHVVSCVRVNSAICWLYDRHIGSFRIPRQQLWALSLEEVSCHGIQFLFQDGWHRFKIPLLYRILACMLVLLTNKMLPILRRRGQVIGKKKYRLIIQNYSTKFFEWWLTVNMVMLFAIFWSLFVCLHVQKGFQCYESKTWEYLIVYNWSFLSTSFLFWTSPLPQLRSSASLEDDPLQKVPKEERGSVKDTEINYVWVVLKGWFQHWKMILSLVLDCLVFSTVLIPCGIIWVRLQQLQKIVSVFLD